MLVQVRDAPPTALQPGPSTQYHQPRLQRSSVAPDAGLAAEEEEEEEGEIVFAGSDAVDDSDLPFAFAMQLSDIGIEGSPATQKPKGADAMKELDALLATISSRPPSAAPQPSSLKVPETALKPPKNLNQRRYRPERKKSKERGPSPLRHERFDSDTSADIHFFDDTSPGLVATFDSLTVSHARQLAAQKAQPKVEESEPIVSMTGSVGDVRVHPGTYYDSIIVAKAREQETGQRQPSRPNSSSSRQPSSTGAAFHSIDLARVQHPKVTGPSRGAGPRQIHSMVSPTAHPPRPALQGRAFSATSPHDLLHPPRIGRLRTPPPAALKGTTDDFTLDSELLSTKLALIAAARSRPSSADAMEMLR